MQPITPGGLAVDSAGEVIVGGTSADVLPVTSGVLASTFPNNTTTEDATAGYVLKLNSAGSALLFSTYIPGTDGVFGVALDASNNIFISGSTVETSLPTSVNAFEPSFAPSTSCDCGDGFLLKLSSDGTTVIAATYVNGNNPHIHCLPLRGCET